MAKFLHAQRLTSALLVTLTLAVSASQANAAKSARDKKAARARQQGLAHYERGDYQAAIKELARSYELKPGAVILFHIARSHEALGDCESALTFVRRYLEAPPRERKDAEALIARCQKRSAVNEAKNAPIAPDQKTVEPTAVEPLTQEAATAARASEPVPAPQITPPSAAFTADANGAPPSDSSVTSPAFEEQVPSPEQAPWYKSTWVWTIVGSVVAAGAGAAALAAH